MAAEKTARQWADEMPDVTWAGVSLRELYLKELPSHLEHIRCDSLPTAFCVISWAQNWNFWMGVLAHIRKVNVDLSQACIDFSRGFFAARATFSMDTIGES